MLIKKLRNYLEPLLILTLSILIFSTIYNIYLLQGSKLYWLGTGSHSAGG